MKWVELKHFQHGYLCLEHIYYWTSAIIKMIWKRFGWCWNTFNICENLCLEHVCYWTSAVLKHIYHYQKSVWVPETPVGAIQYLFRGSIDALVFKYCQIGKQKRCIQCSNIVWKMHWNIQLFSRVIWKNIKTFRAGALKYSKPVLYENAHIKHFWG